MLHFVLSLLNSGLLVYGGLNILIRELLRLLNILIRKLIVLLILFLLGLLGMRYLNLLTQFPNHSEYIL